ncbi:MAG: glycosyltransferase family 2 protein [Planctomycetota bacterium]
MSIIIVNYRTAGLVVDCLRSLAAELASGDSFRVVVVDNASGDGSLAALQGAVAEHGWGGWCDVVDAGRNGGFAFGNNVGMRHAIEAGDARGEPVEALHLLNPDTYVRPGAVRALAAFLAGRAEVGIVGSRLENPDGTVRRGAFRYHTVASEVEGQLRLGPVSRLLSRWVVAPAAPEGAWRVGWVTGASMMIRREAIDAAGLMDDGYFLYFEETDLCLRVARAGWEIWQEPASRVVHLVGQSTGVNQKDAKPRPKPAYWYDSRRRYFEKNFGGVYADAVDAARCVAVLASRGLGAVLGRSGDETLSVSGVLAARRRSVLSSRDGARGAAGAGGAGGVGAGA